MAEEVRTSIRLDSPEQLQQLRQTLADLGYPARQQSRAFRDIADGRLVMLPWTPDVQNALVQAAIALAESNPPQADCLVAALEASPFSDAHKKALTGIQLGQREWVAQVKQFIRDRQPFWLTYHDQLRLCRYAEVRREGDREYIHAWCPQPHGEIDHPRLSHNRLFSTEEVATVEAAADTQWRDLGLDAIEVTFRVNFRYREKSEDLEVTPVMIEGESWTRVRQRVTNLLLFNQRIARYGDRCQLEAPEEAIALFVAQFVTGMMKRYEDYLR